MKCLNCNHENTSNSVFCTNCGAKISETISPIRDNSGGTVVEEENLQEKEKEVKKQKEPKAKKEVKVKQEGDGNKKSKLIFIIPIVLVIIIVGAFGIFSFLNSPERLALKASELVEVEKYEEAIEVYNKILRKDSTNLDTYLELGKIYSIMGELGLQKDILEKGISEVEHNIPLKLALGKYFMEQDLHEEGEEIFLEIISKSGKNLIAYESLMEIYDATHDNGSIISLYKEYGHNVESDKATILVASSYFNIGEVDEADRLFASVNLDGINDSNTLEKIAQYYMRIQDNENALLIANKGLQSDDPSIFYGIKYGLKNKKDFKLINMKSGDVTGDRKKENILLMAENGPGSYSENVEILIQEGATGNIIETISFDDYGGYPGKLGLGDLNHDGILDIIVSVHSGGTAGFESHYAYSYKDKNKVDLLDGLIYDVDIKFLDGYKIAIFAEGIKKAFQVEVQGEQRQRYEDDGYYTSNGMVLNSMYGYFRGDELDIVYIEDIDQYGLKQNTSLIGPSYNADYIVGIESTYLIRDGKWTTYDLKVEDSDNKVSSFDYGKIDEEPVFKSDLERLDKMFAMTGDDIFRKHGAPLRTGWYMGSEYFSYENITYFVYDNKVTMISLGEKEELFGMQIYTNIEAIRNTLGKADFDGYFEEDEYGGGELAPGHRVEYNNIGGYSIDFYSETMNGEFSVSIRKTRY